MYVCMCCSYSALPMNDCIASSSRLPNSLLSTFLTTLLLLPLWPSPQPAVCPPLAAVWALVTMALRVNIPPATRIFLLGLLAFSLLYNIARWRQITGSPTTEPSIPYLTIVPSQFIFYPWTLVTATLVEQNIFTVLLNAATIFYGGKYLERAWGSREFSKFIATISVVPNVVIIPIYILWGAIMSNPQRGYVLHLLYALR